MTFRRFNVGDRVRNTKSGTAVPVGTLGTVVEGPNCTYGATVLWDGVELRATDTTPGYGSEGWRPYWGAEEMRHSDWHDAPRDALWYGEVICSHPDQDTDYFYGYSSDDEAPDVALLVPEGWTLLESTVNATPGNPAFVPTDS